MSTTEDIEAVNRYMMTTEAVTEKAVELKDEWVRWYNDLSWYALNVGNQSTYDEARNRRNAFNLANATTPEERAGAKKVARKGLTTEEMQGGVKRTDSQGRFPEEDKPLIPTEYKVVVGLAVVGLGIVFAYGLATALPTAIAGIFVHKGTQPRRFPQ